jgi:hypothetical protein
MIVYYRRRVNGANGGKAQARWIAGPINVGRKVGADASYGVPSTDWNDLAKALTDHGTLDGKLAWGGSDEVNYAHVMQALSASDPNGSRAPSRLGAQSTTYMDFTTDNEGNALNAFAAGLSAGRRSLSPASAGIDGWSTRPTSVAIDGMSGHPRAGSYGDDDEDVEEENPYANGYLKVAVDDEEMGVIQSIKPTGKPPTDLEYRLSNIAEMKAACDAEILKIELDKSVFSETTRQMLFFTRDSLKAQMHELLESAEESSTANPGPSIAQASIISPIVAASAYQPQGGGGGHFYPSGLTSSPITATAAVDGMIRKTPSFTEDVFAVAEDTDGFGSDAEADAEWAELIGGVGDAHFYPGSVEAEVEYLGVSALPATSPVWKFTGASGPKGEIVNGRYIETSERKNGFPVFAKVGEASKCCWVGPDGHWYLSSSVAKDANRDAGYAISIDPGATSPGAVTRWIVSTGAEFVPQPEMTARLVVGVATATSGSG